MKKLLIILLVLSGIIVFFLLIEKKDYTKFCAKLNVSVNELLNKYGIHKINIISIYRKEYRQARKIWIETKQEIQFPSGFDTDKFQINFENLLKKFKVKKYFYKKTSRTLEYSFGKNKKIFNNIIFYLPGIKLVAIVIDDLGYELKNFDSFLELKVPINFAILPKEKFSVQIAEKLSKLKFPYLLHLPLEPITYPKDNPGKFAIFTDMPDNKIIEIFQSNLRSVLNPVGVNNHMGSKFTSNPDKMKILLEEIKKKELFFLDSYTTPKSVAKKITEEIGLKYLRNDIFLDIVVIDEDSIQKQYEQLLKIADKKGKCIGIGHIHKENTLKILRKNIPDTILKGYKFVFLSEL